MVEIRTITPDDVDLFRRRMARGFGGDLSTDPDAGERFDRIFELDRTFAAFDGGDIVGTVGAFSLELTVPGGVSLPMGGTTVVTVQPTHRRQGVMRGMMERHLEEVRDHGDALAGLWASEASIYGRFGFGPATQRYSTEMTTGEVAFRDTAAKGSVRLVDREEAEGLIRSLYETVRLTRPGMLTRSDGWWEFRVLADVKEWREGKSERRFAVYELDGEALGYAMFRQKARWDDFAGDGEVTVGEMISTGPEGTRGLWSFLTQVDLFPNVEYWNLPLDDPLPALVKSSRGVRRKVGDALWVRLMDVSVALEARTYGYDGSITFDVVDPVFPGDGGTFQLAIEEGAAICRRVTDPPDVTMTSEVLGSLYLGGADAHQLHAAGLIHGDAESVSQLHRLFRGDIAPWCNEVF